MGTVTAPPDDRSQGIVQGELERTTAPQPRGSSLRSWTGPALVFFLAAFVVASGLLFHLWPFRYRNVQPLLQKVFASQVKINHYRCIYFPNPGLIADDLTLRRNSAPDLPALGSAQRLVVEGRWLDLLLLRRHVHLVQVEGLHIVIPAIGSRANHEDFPPGSSADFSGPSTVVEHLQIDDSILDLMRADGSRYTFPIHHLVFGNLRQGETISYSLDMLSPQPSGHILAQGSFGPLVPARLGAMPVSGAFSFAPVLLAQIHGLGGTMSANGSFGGALGAIQAEAKTDTPDFSVHRGRPTHVNATIHTTINGLNGDVHLQSIEARTGRTTVHATGDIAGSPKSTHLDIHVERGRAEDLLAPFLHNQPPVAGEVNLHSFAYLAPSSPGVKFLQRLHMNGAFNIPSERFTNEKVEQKLSKFSRRAQGRKASNDQPVEDVSSSLGGDVVIRDGIASARRLDFQVPGAGVRLNGVFSLRNGDARFLGDLHMASDISHVTTGFKSWLLKPFAPFFRRRGSGAIIPIAVTSSHHKYRVASNLFHRQSAR